jgi:cyclopropane fatty-acyl-phospholipid synthase-like methyltransferase
MGYASSGLYKSRQRPSFAERVKAWWEGIELQPVRRVEPRTMIEVEHKALPTVKLEEWETPEIKVRQAIWGEGYHRPGGDDLVLELVKPFALNNTMSVLDFGCGLGGSTRAIAKAFDIWMTGVERDAAMANAAKILSKRAGLERRAEILAYEEKKFVSRPGGFDCILTVETLNGFEQREILLARLENTLKTRGQLLITDFVVAPGAAVDHPSIKQSFPEDAPALWSHVDYEKRFKELNIDLRISEDLTEKYRESAMNCLAGIAKSPVAIATARALPAAFIAEIESWAKQLAAIDQGILKVRRFYGIKLGASKMMSDWS